MNWWFANRDRDGSDWKMTPRDPAWDQAQPSSEDSTLDRYHKVGTGPQRLLLAGGQWRATSRALYASRHRFAPRPAASQPPGLGDVEAATAMADNRGSSVSTPS